MALQLCANELNVISNDETKDSTFVVLGGRTCAVTLEMAYPTHEMIETVSSYSISVTDFVVTDLPAPLTTTGAFMPRR